MLKTKTERLLALAVAFLAGCEASHIARSAVSTAHAADTPPPGVQQWDYACIVPDGDKTQVEANRLGMGGWELTAAATEKMGMGVGTRWCFKRPHGAPASATNSN